MTGPAAARVLLQTAAVAGNGFSAGVAARMHDQPVLTVLGRLDEWRAAGFLLDDLPRAARAGRVRWPIVGVRQEDVKPFDPGTPSIARVWDYWLGGKDNFVADRELAQTMLAINPLAAKMARENRQFLGRAVSYIVGMGIRQFIDVGAGLPTALNTHDIAQQASPGARVAYVDNDPMVITHARALLASAEGVAAVPGDMRDPAAILANPQLTSLINLSEPVCVILSGVLHFLPADWAREVATAFTRAIVPGSYVIISVGTGQAEVAEPFSAAYTAAPLYIHSPDEVMTFFDGLEVVPPGLVPVRGWQGEATRASRLAPRATFLAGVGHKPD